MSSLGKPQGYGGDQAPLRSLLVPHVDEVPEPPGEHLRAGLAGGQRFYREARGLAGALPGDVQQALVEGPGAVLLAQPGQDVGGAGQDAHGGAPAVGRVGGAEAGADPQGFPVVRPCSLQAQHRLGDDQPDVVLQPVLQAPTPVLPLVPGRGLRVDPHLAVHHGHRKAAHVVGEGIEGAAAGEVEAGMVPVAGEDAVPDAAPVQGKAHVGTPVVHRVGLAFVMEHRDGVSPAGDNGAAPLLDLLQGSGPDASLHGRCHCPASDLLHLGASLRFAPGHSRFRGFSAAR